ncbi:hypothetical protein NDU88_007385 [Pleurodeles waltl]|uniref:Uncharacterized protein n=1 Tax=Pleurodeles waltl TaxID=8319 RepID=A0AAV7NBB9_PLEWA|nr:hypothetical protein NDU88_007385 [Pleurodeles waltl]
MVGSDEDEARGERKTLRRLRKGLRRKAADPRRSRETPRTSRGELYGEPKDQASGKDGWTDPQRDPATGDQPVAVDGVHNSENEQQHHASVEAVKA